MPLVRYEIRNEYSLANPELYRAAGKDDPEALLEGVAMAGLVGIVRQLGDLAEFAAEVFHDLHEEVMATAARGHGLMIRVQQIEAEFPSVEKALMSEKNQLRFAYAVGADWHASIRNDQNHLTQGDLPRFILNSYEECRGPPRLFLLDKFDVAGAGACLKRYTDPSFFKMEWASTELMKAEKAQRQKKARRVKKKGRKQRNGESADVAPINGRVRYSSLDLDRPTYVPGNLMNPSSQKLKSKQAQGYPLLNREVKRDHLKSPLNVSSPKKDKYVPENISCGFDKKLDVEHFNSSPLQDQVVRHYVQDPNKSLFSKDAQKSFSQEWEKKAAIRTVDRVLLADSHSRVTSPESQSSRIIPEVDVAKVAPKFIHGEQKNAFVDYKQTPEVKVDGNYKKQDAKVDDDENDYVASEADNYMDAAKVSPKFIHGEQKNTFVDYKRTSEVNVDNDNRKQEVKVDDYENDDVASEADTYMDALATMDSEMETDCESRMKHEVDSDFNLENREACRELHESFVHFSEFADAEATAFYNCDSSDESSKVETQSRFFSNYPADDASNVESTSYMVSSISECGSGNMMQNGRLDSECASPETSKYSVASSDDESSLPSDVLENVQVSPGENVESDTDVIAIEEKINDIDLLPPVTDAMYHVVIDNIDVNNIENEELCSVFQENDNRDSFSNASSCAGTDNREMSFGFPTSGSSLLGITESEIPFKESVAVFESLEGIADESMKKSSSYVHDDENSAGNSNITESVATSELADGIANGVIHDNDGFPSLEANDAENGVFESIKYEASDTQYVQENNGLRCPSIESVGQISVESDTNIEHSESAVENILQGFAHVESGKDSELRDDQSYRERFLDQIPNFKSEMDAGEKEPPIEYPCAKEKTNSIAMGGKENEELPEHVCARENESLSGLQENDIEGSEWTESRPDIRPIYLQPQLNVTDVYGDDQVTENYSSNIAPIHDSTVCFGDKLTADFDSVCLLEKDSGSDIDLHPQLNVADGYGDDQLTESYSSNIAPIRDSSVCSGDKFTADSDSVSLLEKDSSDDINLHPQLNVTDGYGDDQVTENYSSNIAPIHGSTVCFGDKLTADFDSVCLLEKDSGSDIDLHPQLNVADGYGDDQLTESYSSNIAPIRDSSVCSGDKLTADSDSVSLLEKDSGYEINLRHQMNVADGYGDDQVTENYSSNIAPIQDSTVCAGDKLTGDFDTVSLLEKGLVFDIPMKELEIHSEEAIVLDVDVVKLPVFTCISDSSTSSNKELSDKFIREETSINDVVLPNAAFDSRFTEFYTDGGSFENCVAIDSLSYVHSGAPTEAFDSPPPTDSLSEKVHMDSLHAESKMQLPYGMPPVNPNASPHSTSFDAWTNSGALKENVEIEPHRNLLFVAPTEICKSSPSANSSSERVHTDSINAKSDMHILHVIQPVKPIGADPILDVISPVKPVGAEPIVDFIPPVKPVGAEPIVDFIPPVKPVNDEPHASSPPNFTNKDNVDGEPPSPPLEHIKISFPPTSDSPLSMCSTNSDHVSESSSPERCEQSQRKVHELCSFSLLPEPAIPLQLVDENPSIQIMGSLSSHRQRNSPEIHISQMRDAENDFEDEELMPFGKSSADFSPVFYNQSLEPTEGLAVFSGRTAVSDADSCSSGVLTNSLSISSSPERTGNSLLNVKCSSADASPSSSHSRNISLGSSPRSFVVSTPHSPVSVEEICHRNQGLSSHSPVLETREFDPMSSTVESELDCNWSDMPSCPPEACYENQDSYRSQSSALELGALVQTSSTVEPNSECKLFDMSPPQPEACHKKQDLSRSPSPEFEALVANSSIIKPNSEYEWHDMSPPHLEACHKNRDLSRNQSSVLESGELVLTSSTSEPECNWNEMRPPPLPPAEWKLRMPHQMNSLAFLEGVQPPSPHALPPLVMPKSSMEDGSASFVCAIQNAAVERHDSLIEAIASHDKTTLKKVPKEIQPIVAKPVDEREVLLEQIRSKSFNLRRTSVVKHNIARPVTNINVAAILEKANAIRQAFTGSDEEEEDDDWGDT